MEQLKNEDIEKMFQDYVRKGLPVIKRGKAGIITNVKEGEHKYFLLGFPNQKFIAEPIKYKIGWGELGKFIFTYAQATRREEAHFNLATLKLYDKQTGNRIDTPHFNNELVPLNKVIILNSCILAVCSEKKQFPRFFAVIGTQLKEIPATVVESALLFVGLIGRHKTSLINCYQSKGWEVHNGIIINPQTLDVPTELHFQFWRRKQRNRVMPGKFDMFLLATILAGPNNEKPTIRYITL